MRLHSGRLALASCSLLALVFALSAFSGTSMAANPCSVGSGGGSFDAGTYNCNGGNVGGPGASITISPGASVTINNVSFFQAASITGNGGTNQNGASMTLSAANVSIGSISLNGGGGNSASGAMSVS